MCDREGERGIEGEREEERERERERERENKTGKGVIQRKGQGRTA